MLYLYEARKPHPYFTLKTECRAQEMNCEDSSNQSPVICDRGRHHKVKWKKVPVGAWVLSYLGIFNLLPAKR